MEVGSSKFRQYGQGSYPIATANGKGRREEIAIVNSTAKYKKILSVSTRVCVVSDSNCRLVLNTPPRPLAARDFLTPLGGASVIGRNGIDWRDVITSSVTAANLHAHPGRSVASDICYYGDVIY